MLFSTIHNGWQNFWIGARGGIYGGWLWYGGPEKGQKFWQGGPFDLAIRIPDDLETQVGMVQAEKVNSSYLKVSDIAASRRKANVLANNSQRIQYKNFLLALR